MHPLYMLHMIPGSQLTPDGDSKSNVRPAAAIPTLAKELIQLDVIKLIGIFFR